MWVLSLLSFAFLRHVHVAFAELYGRENLLRYLYPRRWQCHNFGFTRKSLRAHISGATSPRNRREHSLHWRQSHDPDTAANPAWGLRGTKHTYRRHACSSAEKASEPLQTVRRAVRHQGAEHRICISMGLCEDRRMGRFSGTSPEMGNSGYTDLL